MEQRILGATGRRVTSLGLGAMPLAITGRPEEADAVRVVHRALELGVSWIDVAVSVVISVVLVVVGFWTFARLERAVLKEI